MTREQDQAALAAQRWYGTHRAEHLARDCDRMVDRCAAHLVEVLPIATATARLVAMQSLAEIESADAPGFVDIDRSNARMVVLRDTATGDHHMLTLTELFQLVRTRQRSQPAAG